MPGLGEGIVEKLNAAGVTTVEALADMTPEQLEAIEGIGPKTVEKISLAVNNYFASLDQEAGVEGAAVEGETPSGEGEAVAASPEAEALPEEAITEGTTEADALDGTAAEEAATDETAEVPAVADEDHSATENAGHRESDAAQESQK